MNMEITYLYRDASNYKQHEFVVVAVPDSITPEALKAALRQRFAAHQVWPDILHFRPEDLDWPTAYFEDHDPLGDDLDLHELEDIQPTDAEATATAKLGIPGLVSPTR